MRARQHARHTPRRRRGDGPARAVGLVLGPRARSVGAAAVPGGRHPVTGSHLAPSPPAARTRWAAHARRTRALRAGAGLVYGLRLGAPGGPGGGRAQRAPAAPARAPRAPRQGTGHAAFAGCAGPTGHGRASVAHGRRRRAHADVGRMAGFARARRARGAPCRPADTGHPPATGTAQASRERLRESLSLSRFEPPCASAGGRQHGSARTVSRDRAGAPIFGTRREARCKSALWGAGKGQRIDGRGSPRLPQRPERFGRPGAFGRVVPPLRALALSARRA